MSDGLGTPDLSEQAGRAWELAPELCPRSLTGDCVDYHRLWPTLRLLGLAAAPDRHEAFFGQALAGTGGAGPEVRVLVSGSADHGMAALALAALRAGDRAVAMTAVDLCPTPLALAAAHGERIGVRIRTLVADVGEAGAAGDAGGYDLICTHSLLTVVPPARRQQVVARWAQLLAPGGRLVTVARIADHPPGSASAAGPDDFAESVRRAAERHRDVVPAPPQELADVARRYAARPAPKPIGSPAELTALLQGAGFTRIDLGLTALTGPPCPGSAPVGLARAGRYAEVVASLGTGP